MSKEPNPHQHKRRKPTIEGGGAGPSKRHSPSPREEEMEETAALRQSPSPRAEKLRSWPEDGSEERQELGAGVVGMQIGTDLQADVQVHSLLKIHAYCVVVDSIATAHCQIVGPWEYLPDKTIHMTPKNTKARTQAM